MEQVRTTSSTSSTIEEEKTNRTHSYKKNIPHWLKQSDQHNSIVIFASLKKVNKRIRVQNFIQNCAHCTHWIRVTECTHRFAILLKHSVSRRSFGAPRSSPNCRIKISLVCAVRFQILSVLVTVPVYVRVLFCFVLFHFFFNSDFSFFLLLLVCKWNLFWLNCTQHSNGIRRN